MNLLSQLEALLFVAGEEGIGLSELAKLLQLDAPACYQQLLLLEERYVRDNASALHILEAGETFILTTKKKQAALLKEYARSALSHSLSKAALETLSVIAYKQPITRIGVEEIRGVQSSGPIQKLTARQLIEEKGREEGPGRPILYGTTAYFMDYFGLKSLAELPDIQQMEEDLADDSAYDLYFDRFEEEE